MTDIRKMPSSEEAENAILGAILFDPPCIEKVMPWVPKLEVFWRHKNRYTYQALLELYNKQAPIDSITLLEHIKSKYGEDSEYYSPFYIAEIMEKTVSSNNVEYYSQLLYKKYVQRELILSGDKLRELSYTSDNTERMLADHSRLVEEFMSLRPDRHRPVDQLIQEAVTNIKTADNIIPFGIAALDHPAGGMTRREVTILGGRPSHGKTSLALNIVKSLIEQGYRVIMFNREMTNTEMLKKLLVLESKALSYMAVRKRTLQDEDMEEIDRVKEIIETKYKNLQMYDDIRTLEESIREIRRYKPDIVIDDYIQLIKQDKTHEGRRFEIEEIMTEYKWTVKVENCAALLISQLNREIEKRLDPEPKMSDYAESGTIEQVAENAIFVYREYVFNPEEADPFEAKIITAKARYGEIGSYPVGFHGDRCRFFATPQEAKICD